MPLSLLLQSYNCTTSLTHVVNNFLCPQYRHTRSSWPKERLILFQRNRFLIQNSSFSYQSCLVAVSQPIPASHDSRSLPWAPGIGDKKWAEDVHTKGFYRNENIPAWQQKEKGDLGMLSSVGAQTLGSSPRILFRAAEHLESLELDGSPRSFSNGGSGVCQHRPQGFACRTHCSLSEFSTS